MLCRYDALERATIIPIVCTHTLPWSADEALFTNGREYELVINDECTYGTLRDDGNFSWTIYIRRTDIQPVTPQQILLRLHEKFIDVVNPHREALENMRVFAFSDDFSKDTRYFMDISDEEFTTIIQ